MIEMLPGNHNIENSKLRLACLKENFDYRNFYENNQTDIEKCILNPDGITAPDFLLSTFEQNFGIKMRALTGLTPEEKESILSPFITLEQLTVNSELTLPTVFKTPAIQKVNVVTDSAHPELTECRANVFSYPDRPIQPKSYERLLLIDLGKSRQQLLDEFTAFIDNAGCDSSRQRKEAWQQLKIWQLRKEKNTFNEIAQILKISEDSSKKAFYKAYERTQNRKYNPDRYNEFKNKVYKNELSKLCDSCPNYKTCKDLCPEKLRFVDQDYAKLNWHERRITDMDYKEP